MFYMVFYENQLNSGIFDMEIKKILCTYDILTLQLFVDKNFSINYIITKIVTFFYVLFDLILNLLLYIREREKQRKWFECSVDSFVMLLLVNNVH
jgi:hypothetical protein